MRIAFYASDKPRERLLADAFLMGCAKHGHETTMVPLGDEPEPGSFDVVGIVGVKSRERFRAQLRAGSHVIYFDKGYSRHKSRGEIAGWEYWRIAIDAHHPTRRLGELALPNDRLSLMGWEMQPWRKATAEGPIIIAGSSAKYHEFYGLSDPTKYARELVRELRAVSDRPLIYRPKPSWREAVAIAKARFSQNPETLGDLLASAHVLVTHGSNACFEAVLAGVPCIILGDGVARPLSDTTLHGSTVSFPHLASDAERLRWAANLAYFQWTNAEFASGGAWEFMGQAIHAV